MGLKTLWEGNNSRLEYFLNETSILTKKKNWWVGLHEIKEFLHTEETVTRTAHGLGKFLTDHTSDRALESRIHKEQQKLNFQKGHLVNQNTNWRKWTESAVLWRRNTDSQQILEKASILIIRKMQIKIALRFPLTPVSVAVNQKTDETNTGEDVGK